MLHMCVYCGKMSKWEWEPLMFVSQTLVSSCILALFGLPFPAFLQRTVTIVPTVSLVLCIENISLDRRNVIVYLAKLLPNLPSLLHPWTCFWVFILGCTVAPNTCYLASYFNFQFISPTKWYFLLWSLTSVPCSSVTSIIYFVSFHSICFKDLFRSGI